MMSSSIGAVPSIGTPLGNIPAYRYMFTSAQANTSASSPYYYSVREFQLGASTVVGNSSSTQTASTQFQAGTSSHGSRNNPQNQQQSHTTHHAGESMERGEAGDSKERSSKQHYSWKDTNTRNTDKFNKSTPNFFPSEYSAVQQQQQQQQQGFKDKEKLNQIQKIYTNSNNSSNNYNGNSNNGSLASSGMNNSVNRQRYNFHKSQNNFYNMHSNAFFNNNNVTNPNSTVYSSTHNTNSQNHNGSIERSQKKQKYSQQQQPPTTNRLSQSPSLDVKMPASSSSLSQPNLQPATNLRYSNKLKPQQQQQQQYNSQHLMHQENTIIGPNSHSKDSKSQRNSISYGKNQQEKQESLNSIYKPIKQFTNNTTPSRILQIYSQNGQHASLGQRSSGTDRYLIGSTPNVGVLPVQAGGGAIGSTSSVVTTNNRFYQTEPNFNKKSGLTANAAAGSGSVSGSVATIASSTNNSTLSKKQSSIILPSKVLSKTKLLPISTNNNQQHHYHHPQTLSENEHHEYHQKIINATQQTPASSTRKFMTPQMHQQQQQQNTTISMTPTNPFKKSSNNIMRFTPVNAGNHGTVGGAFAQKTSIKKQWMEVGGSNGQVSFAKINPVMTSSKLSSQSTIGGAANTGTGTGTAAVAAKTNNEDNQLQNYEESFDTLNQSSKLQCSSQDIYNYDIDIDEVSSLPTKSKKSKKQQEQQLLLQQHDDQDDTAEITNTQNTRDILRQSPVSKQKQEYSQQPIIYNQYSQEGRKSIIQQDLEVIVEQNREEEQPKEVPLDLLAQVQKISEARPKTSEGGRRRRPRFNMQNKIQPQQNEEQKPSRDSQDLQTNEAMLVSQTQTSKNNLPTQTTKLRAAEDDHDLRKLDFSPLKNQESHEFPEDDEEMERNYGSGAFDDEYQLYEENRNAQNDRNSSHYTTNAWKAMPKQSMFRSQAEFYRPEHFSKDREDSEEFDNLNNDSNQQMLSSTKSCNFRRRTVNQPTIPSQQSHTQVQQPQQQQQQSQPRMMNFFQKGLSTKQSNTQQKQSQQQLQQQVQGQRRVPADIPFEVHVQEDEREYVYQECDRNQRTIVKKHPNEFDVGAAHKIIIRHNKSAAGNKVRPTRPGTISSSATGAAGVAAEAQIEQGTTDQMNKQQKKKGQLIESQYQQQSQVQDDVVERVVVPFKTGLDSDFINLFAAVPSQF